MNAAKVLVELASYQVNDTMDLSWPQIYTNTLVPPKSLLK